MHNFDAFRLALIGNAQLRRNLIQAYQAADARAVLTLCRTYQPAEPVSAAIHEALFLAPFLALNQPAEVSLRRQQQALARLIAQSQSRSVLWRQFWQLGSWLVGLVDREAMVAFHESRRSILASVAIWAAASQMGYLFEPLPLEHPVAAAADWHFRGTFFRVFAVAEGRGPRLRYIQLAADAPLPSYGQKITIEMEALHHRITAELARSGETYLGVLIVISDAGFHPDTGAPTLEVISTLAYFLVGLRA